jgi:hypothetical protein
VRIELWAMENSLPRLRGTVEEYGFTLRPPEAASAKTSMTCGEAPLKDARANHDGV